MNIYDYKQIQQCQRIGFFIYSPTVVILHLCKTTSPIGKWYNCIKENGRLNYYCTDAIYPHFRDDF